MSLTYQDRNKLDSLYNKVYTKYERLLIRAVTDYIHDFLDERPLTENTSYNVSVATPYRHDVPPFLFQYRKHGKISIPKSKDIFKLNSSEHIASRYIKTFTVLGMKLDDVLKLIQLKKHKDNTYSTNKYDTKFIEYVIDFCSADKKVTVTKVKKNTKQYNKKYGEYQYVITQNKV